MGAGKSGMIAHLRIAINLKSVRSASNHLNFSLPTFSLSPEKTNDVHIIDSYLFKVIPNDITLKYVN